MRVIREYNGEIKEVDYPHVDISKPVVGLDKAIKYYFIEQADKPAFDADKSYLKPTQTLSTDVHPKYKHLLICYRGYEIIDYTQAAIIQKLNDSLGNHLDNEYPLWERQKHSDELAFGSPTTERKAYIESLKTWEFAQREERDNRESEYITNGVFPDLHNWESRPPKPY